MTHELHVVVPGHTVLTVMNTPTSDRGIVVRELLIASTVAEGASAAGARERRRARVDVELIERSARLLLTFTLSP